MYKALYRPHDLILAVILFIMTVSGLVEGADRVIVLAGFLLLSCGTYFWFNTTQALLTTLSVSFLLGIVFLVNKIVGLGSADHRDYLAFALHLVSLSGVYYLIDKRSSNAPILIVPFVLTIFFLWVVFQGLSLSVFLSGFNETLSVNHYSALLLFTSAIIIIFYREKKPAILMLLAMNLALQYQLLSRIGIFISVVFIFLYLFQLLSSRIRSFIALLGLAVLMFYISSLYEFYSTYQNSPLFFSPRTIFFDSYFIDYNWKDFIFGKNILVTEGIQFLDGNPHNSFIFLNYRFGFASGLMFIFLSMLFLRLVCTSFLNAALFLLVMVKCFFDTLVFTNSFFDLIFPILWSFSNGACNRYRTNLSG